MKNKYEQRMDEMLQQMNLQLVKLKNDKWMIKDKENFYQDKVCKNTADVLESLNMFIDDYIINDLEDNLSDKDVAFESFDFSKPKDVENAKFYSPDYEWEIDVLEAINHQNEIDLNNCEYTKEK